MSSIKINMSGLASVRLVSLMGISFFIGLQFRSLRVLFRTNYFDGPGNEYLAIAPIEISRGLSSRHDKRRKQNAAVVGRRGLGAKNHKYEDDNSKKKKKSPKPRTPARFNAGNYTKDFEPLPWSLPEPSPLIELSSAEFMDKYISMKQKENIELPWGQSNNDYGATKLPLPIISLNFPKSATLTMRQFFKCGGVTSVHTSSQQGRLGICMMENMLADNPPMENCDTHKRQRGTNKIGFISDIGLQGPPCFYSSLHDGGLEAIAKHYPTSTILLVTRKSTSWHRSIKNWGTLLHRWKNYCKFDGSHHGEQVQYWKDLYENESKDKYWSDFYNAHTQKIREFALKHLSLTYVEVQLEDPKMGELLEYYTGIPSTCVMDCHPGPHWHKNTNATSKCHPPGDPMGLTLAPKSALNVHADDDDDKNDDNNQNNDDDEIEGDEVR
jgi:hypothetical protein